MQPRVGQIQEGGVPCGCGRSPTGFCIGLHALTNEQYDQYIKAGHVYPGELVEKDDKDES